jgi:uncharacterized protein (TIGR00266 family)
MVNQKTEELEETNKMGFKQFVIPPPGVNSIWEILGADSQILEIAVSPGMTVITEPSTMCYVGNKMEPSIQVGGCFDAWKRSHCSDESFFRLAYTNNSKEPKPIGLTPNFPAKIIPIDLSVYSGIRIKSGSFMASIGEDVHFNLSSVKGVAGCCGGQGFILNELHGKSMVFLNAGGTIVQKILKPKEIILVDTHSVVAFEKSVKYSVQGTGGCFVMCCGGEGMFNTKFTGPGSIWVQSLSFEKFISKISRRMRHEMATDKVKDIQ